jgi:hypothetical protein
MCAPNNSLVGSFNYDQFGRFQTCEPDRDRLWVGTVDTRRRRQVATRAPSKANIRVTKCIPGRLWVRLSTG